MKRVYYYINSFIYKFIMFNNKIITYVFIYLYMIFGCIKNHTKTLKIKDFIDSQKINIILNSLNYIISLISVLSKLPKK